MPVLYSFDLSPPCRAVLMTAKIIGLTLEIRTIRLFETEQLTDDFIKINPQHTIPTLDDDGFITWDSHVIMRYLVSKYAKDDSLYPKDLQKRASIDRFLHFEGEKIFQHFRMISISTLYKKEKTIPEDSLKEIKQTCTLLDKFLVNKKWLTGHNYTIADLSCISSISSIKAIVSLDKYKNIVTWMETCKREIPGYAETNEPGSIALGDMFTKLLKE